MFMFPGDGFDQATIDKFNAIARDELEEIRDFLVLHYTATERDDTPFWRHCRAITKPDTLRQRWEMYERSGNIIIEAGELFKEVELVRGARRAGRAGRAPIIRSPISPTMPSSHAASS